MIKLSRVAQARTDAPYSQPEPFDHAEWIFELRLDGFRALPYLDNGEGRLVSRNGNTFASFRDLAADVAASFRGKDAVLDGEIVSLDEHGYQQFEDLLFRRGELFGDLDLN